MRPDMYQHMMRYGGRPPPNYGAPPPGSAYGGPNSMGMNAGGPPQNVPGPGVPPPGGPHWSPQAAMMQGFPPGSMPGMPPGMGMAPQQMPGGYNRPPMMPPGYLGMHPGMAASQVMPPQYQMLPPSVQGQPMMPPNMGGYGRPPMLPPQQMMMQMPPGPSVPSPVQGPTTAVSSSPTGQATPNEQASPSTAPAQKVPPRPNQPFTVNARRFAVESFTGTGRCNFAKASLKKASECFYMDRRRNALICQGPKRSNLGACGCAIAYANSGALVAISDSAETGDDYLSWLRKRLRIDTLGEIEFRVVNIGVQGTVERGKELRVAEFYLVLKKWFGHWTTIYEPNISPYLTIIRSPPRDPGLGMPKMPPHIVGALRPIQTAVYETLARETAEDINYAQILAHSGVAPTAPVGTSPDADAYLHSTGRSAVYLVDASSLSIHRVQEEHEMYAAWGFMMPLISCFIESSPRLYTTLITP